MNVENKSRKLRWDSEYGIFIMKKMIQENQQIGTRQSEMAHRKIFSCCGVLGRNLNEFFFFSYIPCMHATLPSVEQEHECFEVLLFHLQHWHFFICSLRKGAGHLLPF